MFLRIHNSVWRRPHLAVFLAVALAALAIAPHFVFANEVLEKAVVSFFGYVAILLIKMFGFLLSWAVKLIILVAQHNVFINSRAVSIGWVVVRDVMNMFFIIILLVIAIGTILRSQRFTYKNTIVKMIIMVIVVNFSKTITGFFIDASNVVMGAFVDAVKGNAEAHLISGFGITDMLRFADPNQETTVEIGLIDTLVGIYLAVFMFIIATIVSIVIVIILLARIIALWILIILSPVAFVADILPITQKYAGQWWQAFTKYLIVGPVLMFFFWLSLIVMSDPTGASPIDLPDAPFTDIKSSTVQGGSSPKNIAAAATAISTPQRMFDYMVAIGLLFATLQMAQSMGVAGGSLAGKAHQLAQGALVAPLKKTAQFGGYLDRKIGKKLGFSFTTIGATYDEFKKRMEINKQRDFDEIRGKAKEHFGTAYKETKEYTQEDLDQWVVERMADTGQTEEQVKESDEYKKQEKEKGKYLKGQFVKPGLHRIIQMALMNPGDFVREFGNWSSILPSWHKLPESIRGTGRMWKAIAPKMLSGGFDPRELQEEMAEADRKRSEAEKSQEKLITTKDKAKRETDLQRSEVELHVAQSGFGKNNRVNLQAALQEALRTLPNFIGELERIQKRIGDLRQEEADAKSKKDAPAELAARTERERLMGEKSKLEEYIEGVQTYSTLTSTRGSLEAQQKMLEDERSALEKKIASGEGSAKENAGWQKRIDEIDRESGRITYSLEQNKDEMFKTNKDNKGFRLDEILDSMDSKVSDRIKHEFQEAFDDITRGIAEAREELSEHTVVSGESELAIRQREQQEELEKAQREFLEAKRKMDVVRAPSFFHLDAHRRSLEAEAAKTVDTDNWTEYVHAMRSALLRRDHIEFNALFRKAASDGNDNEVFDNFGFYSGAQGAKSFKRIVMQEMLEMGEQLANSSMNDIEYINEKINHWGVARGHHVNEFGLYKEHTAEDQAIERFVEMNKLNNENFLRAGNRLAYGGEKPMYDPHSRQWSRQFQFEPHGIAMIASNYGVIRSQFPRGRFNTNAAQMMMQSPIALRQLHDLASSGVVDRNDFEKFIGELRGYANSTQAPPFELVRMMQRRYG